MNRGLKPTKMREEHLLIAVQIKRRHQAPQGHAQQIPTISEGGARIQRSPWTFHFVDLVSLLCQLWVYAHLIDYFETENHIKLKYFYGFLI